MIPFVSNNIDSQSRLVTFTNGKLRQAAVRKRVEAKEAIFGDDHMCKILQCQILEYTHACMSSHIFSFRRTPVILRSTSFVLPLLVMTTRTGI